MIKTSLLALISAAHLTTAYPSTGNDDSFYPRLFTRDGPINEWTSMGDSYASGVGAGPQPENDKNRCFRFPNAYPAVLQTSLKPQPPHWNQVACSGNTATQIKDNELLDEPKDDGKNGVRPRWGDNPEFVTITMGGNDIGILNLVATCILSFKLWGLDCEGVIKYGQGVIDSDDFKKNLDDLMKAVIAKGRGTKVGDKFKVFVVGYAQFFNQKTTQCNDVTFKPSWNPLAAQYLTVERRTAMNTLAINLNKALSDLANRFKDQGVYYIDYDQQMEGHRFCDREEPKPDDPDTYFFAYYTKDDPANAAAQRFFQNMPAYEASIKGQGGPTLKTDEDYINALADAAGDDPAAQSFLSDTVRMFHPTSLGHQLIRDVVLKNLASNGISGSSTGGDASSAPPPAPTKTEPPANPPPSKAPEPPTCTPK